jgi:hypothetical protein
MRGYKGEPLTEPTWAIALCEPNRDFEVDLRLRRSGYRVVFLTYRRQLTGHNRPGWRQTSEFIGVPLLSGYLFLDLHQGQPRPDADRVAGYIGLMNDGKARLPSYTIADWQRRMYAGEFDDVRPYIPESERPRFQPATTPEERRKLFEAKFGELFAAQDLVAS